MLPITIEPQAGAQRSFFENPADICFYGGAAGGGKTWALLAEPLRHIHNPGFGCVIFRRTMPQITAEGGLWDAATKIYPKFGGKPRLSPNLSYTFPSGAKVEFRPMQHDKNAQDWQGSEIPLIEWDEVTHFTEKQFWYLLSRNRSLCGVRPYIRATCNPSPGWVKNVLAQWVDPNHPTPAKSGELRYFIRRDNEIVWVDKSYRDEDGLRPLSLSFIVSTIRDNQILLDTNPEYLSALKSLPLIDQERLLRGNWNVFEGAFFAEFSEHAHCEPREWTPDNTPKTWNFGGGFDWGFANPYSFGLYATDERGDEHALDELYKAGLENKEQALAVKGKLIEWGLEPGEIPIAFDPSMWAKKRQGEGLKPKADIEDFINAGLRCIRAENNRRHGLSQMRSYLHIPGKFRINKTRCPNLVREFQTAVFDERDAEDMDTTQSDHALDQCRYHLMTRLRPAIVEASDPAEKLKNSEFGDAILRRGVGAQAKRPKL